MKGVVSIKIRTFKYESEDESKVKSILERFSKNIKENTIEGFHGEKIKIFEIFTNKQKEVLELLKKVLDTLDDFSKDYLITTLMDRIDEENVVHFRLDKQTLFYSGIGLITDGGDVVKVEVRFTRNSKEKDIFNFFKNLISE